MPADQSPIQSLRCVVHLYPSGWVIAWVTRYHTLGSGRRVPISTRYGVDVPLEKLGDPAAILTAMAEQYREA